MTQLHDILIDDDRLGNCCRRYGVKRLWLFGSILRPTFRPDSDVDVLVMLDQPIGIFLLGGLTTELTELLGRPVHLTTLSSVPDSVQPELLQTARLQYAA
jgi:predicted nucleotidyltransferase